MKRSKIRHYKILFDDGKTVSFSRQEIAIVIRQASYLVYNYFKPGTHSIKNFFYPGDMTFSSALMVAIKYSYPDTERQEIAKKIIELICEQVFMDICNANIIVSMDEPVDEEEAAVLFKYFIKDDNRKATELSDMLERAAASVDQSALVLPADLIRWTPIPPPEIAEEWSC